MVFPIRQKGVSPLLLPASMLQLPRCLVRICNLFHKDNQLRISKFQKMQLQQEKQFSKTNLLRKCGLLAHTSAAFLKNCCTEKLFIRLRLVLGKPPESGSARLGHIPSLPWESQLPLKPCISLQPPDSNGNCDSFDSLFDFCFSSLCSFICSANVGCSPTPRQHF